MKLYVPFSIYAISLVIFAFGTVIIVKSGFSVVWVAFTTISTILIMYYELKRQSVVYKKK